MSPQHANQSGQQLYETRAERYDTGPEFESISYAPPAEPAAHPSARYDQYQYHAKPQAGQPFLAPEPAEPPGRLRQSRTRAAMSGAALKHAIGYPLVALIMLLIGLGIGGAGDEDPVTAETSAGSSATSGSGGDDAKPDAGSGQKTAAGLGDPVRDGEFRLTVTKVKTGVKQVGDAGRARKAEGQFVLVSLTVQNLGDDARAFDGAPQVLSDAEGNEYEADTAAAGQLGDAESFGNDIDPGAKAKGVVVFDVPKDFRPAKIELHGSPSGKGADVVLP